MKKLKLICSAIAAFGLLALAGCDLEISDSSKVEYAESNIEDVSGIPFYYDGRLLYNTQVAACESITETTGASISLMYKLSALKTDNTFEWESPLKISDKDEKNVIWIDFGPLGIWLAGGGVNFFEGEAKDANGNNGDWTAFCQTGDPVCMTVSFNVDGTISYYKDGVLAFTFSGSKESVNVADGCKQAIKNIAENGFIVHATHNSDKSYETSYLCIDAAVDDAKAKEIATTLIAKYNSN
ncbi:MAG: hypothetical protein IJ717_05875 [Treponema sp.]|nr:hypothetical protein [Treponema sp.]